MKKFINTASWLTVLVVCILDFSALFFLIFSIQKAITSDAKSMAILFGIVMLFAFFVAIKVSIDQCKGGVEFKDTQCVFNTLDCDNIFAYTAIDEVLLEKDEKISFIKNFLDRSGFIKLKTNDGRIHVINLEMVSRGKLKQIVAQIEMRRPS